MKANQSYRYRLHIGPPVYRTKTSVILRAQDLNEQADYGVIFDNWDTGNVGKLDGQDVATKVESIGLDSELFWNGSEDNESISKEDFVDICKRQLEDGPRVKCRVFGCGVALMRHRLDIMGKWRSQHPRTDRRG